MNKGLTKISEIILEISMGPFGSDIKVDNFVETGVPVLNGANLPKFKLLEKEFRYVTAEKAKTFRKAIAKRGDIVITHRGTIGQISYIPENSKFEEYVISQSQFRVDLNKKLVDPAFFVYYFHTNEGQKRLLANKCHVGVPALAQATTNFRLIEIPLPSLPTQQNIASVLSSLDSKIELNNRINADLEAMAKTLYDYWFVQFDFPDKNGKPYKTSGGKMVWNEALKREIPEGWEISSVNDLLIKYSDKSIHIDSKQILKKGKYPVITQDNGDYISGFTNEENPINEIPLIVFGDHSCTLRYIDFPFFRGADGTQLMYFGDNLTIFIFIYLKSVINQLPGYGKYERHFKYLKEFKILVPESRKLKDFQIQLEPIFKKISKSRLENQKLAELRDWLLPMLMNGQVKVSER